MESWIPVSLPNVGWATAVGLGLVLAGLIMTRKWSKRDKKEAEVENELRAARKEYYDATEQVPPDPGRIHVAGKRLQDATAAYDKLYSATPSPSA